MPVKRKFSYFLPSGVARPVSFFYFQQTFIPSMKWFCLLFTALAFTANAQTRWFVSAGTNTVTQFTAEPNLGLTSTSTNSISSGTSNNDNKFGKYLRLSLTMEKRVYGPYYWLTGF